MSRRNYQIRRGIVAEVGDSAGDGCDSSERNTKAGLRLASERAAEGDRRRLGKPLEEGSHFSARKRRKYCSLFAAFFLLWLHFSSVNSTSMAWKSVIGGAEHPNAPSYESDTFHWVGREFKYGPGLLKWNPNGPLVEP
ncbi:hypothetical protein ACFX11_017854 [Malus domestica]